MEHRRHERIMGKLKDAIIAKFAALNPSRPITHELHLHLQKRLSDLLPSSKIPSHPPYAWMIRRAIMDLNEECGSTEEAVSISIREQNDDLPYAHSSFLSHYLGILVRNGELCLNGDKYCILLPAMVHCSEDKDAKNVPGFKLRRRCNMSLWLKKKKKRKQEKNQKVNNQKKREKQNTASVVKGEERTELVCGLTANSTTRQDSQPKTVNGTQQQQPASSYLSKSEPKSDTTPQRSTQNEERPPLKVYYRRKLRVASVNSSTQNQLKAGKIYHEENVMSYLPTESKENYRSTTVITWLEHKQQLRWGIQSQRQRPKGIRVVKIKCQIADEDHKT